MRILLILFLAAFLFGACNKDVTTVAVPPFSIAPNPCRGEFIVYPSPTLQGSASLVYSLYDRNGRLKSEHTFIPATTAGPLAFMLDEPGIYYLEMKVDGQSFQAEILNLD